MADAGPSEPGPSAPGPSVPGPPAPAPAPAQKAISWLRRPSWSGSRSDSLKVVPTTAPPRSAALERISARWTSSASLTENTTWYARISARDVEEQSATPDTISFFVRGGNEPPPVPQLVSPQENEVTDGTPTLVVTTVPDPEGDVVTYEFVVGDTRDLAGVVGVSSGTREWQVDRTLVGGYWWTVRAVDSQGARSDWAEPRYGLAVDPTWGSCSAAGQGSPHLLWLLLPLGLRIRRRR